MGGCVTQEFGFLEHRLLELLGPKAGARKKVLERFPGADAWKKSCSGYGLNAPQELTDLLLEVRGAGNGLRDSFKRERHKSEEVEGNTEKWRRC